MKSVLISTRPEGVERIVSGEETVEVRKSRPKIGTPFKCYIYETNWKDNTYWKNKHRGKLGKVIGEFVCDRIDKFSANCYGWYRYPMEETCLWADEIARYGQGKPLYGWHISDLKIYDKPKELSEFKHHCRYEFDDDFKHCYDCDYHYYSNTPSSGIEEYCSCDGLKTLESPPQSWCHCEELKEI